MDIEAYVKAHEADIAALVSVYGRKDRDRGKQVFQTLPRHMRRRAMSHQAHRVPQRLRKAHERDLEGVVSRKQRRRHSVREVRGDSLSTHIWHAKRFRMLKMFGTRLPISSFVKRARFVRRQAAINAVVHDISYYKCFAYSDTLLQHIKKRGIQPLVISGSPRLIAVHPADTSFVLSISPTDLPTNETALIRIMGPKSALELGGVRVEAIEDTADHVAVLPRGTDEVYATWHRLVQSHAAVGIEEYYSILLYRSDAAYPVDFPGSPAYAAATEQRIQGMKEEWQKKPPGKRPKEEPREPDWKGLSDSADPDVVMTTSNDADGVNRHLLTCSNCSKDCWQRAFPQTFLVAPLVPLGRGRPVTDAAITATSSGDTVGYVTNSSRGIVGGMAVVKMSFIFEHFAKVLDGKVKVLVNFRNPQSSVEREAEIVLDRKAAWKP